MISGSNRNEIKMNYQEDYKTINSLKNGNWTLEYGFKEFERYCLLKNLRERTIEGYRECFERFNRFISPEQENVLTGALQRSDVENYIINLRNTGMRETSINAYLRGLRTYLNFLADQEASIRIKLPIYKAEKKIKETYTDSELYKLLQKPNIRKCDFTEYRNWVIVNFFLATGVRVSTLVNIKIEDIDFDFDRIHLIYTKSRKSYIIPMSLSIKEILIEYMAFRKGESKDYLFCSPYGEPMTTDSVKHAIAKYNKARGVQRSGLHAFRHTFAKKCVMNNVNVFVLQRLLGHTDISVTKEYVDLYADDLAINIQKYNPLDTFEFNNKKTSIANKKAKIQMLK